MSALDELLDKELENQYSEYLMDDYLRLRKLAAAELVQLRAAVIEVLAVIEPMIKEENNPSWPGITPQDCKAATAWVDKFQDLLKRVDQK